MLVLTILMLALTRAEIIERMRSPVLTQADGLIKVYASCPEDMRREFQSPIARFAAETVKKLYGAQSMKPVRFQRPGIVIVVGSGRTNNLAVISRVHTNAEAIVSRIYVPSPGYADIGNFRTEIVKAFYRSVKGRELSDAEANEAYRNSDPEMRVADRRRRLEEWLRGEGAHNDEEMISYMRKVLEPGKASRRDVLIFASRLFLYPDTYCWKFADRFDRLSFKEAVKYAKIDGRIRNAALTKASEVVIFGGGRGELMSEAANAYSNFLLELAKLEKSGDELLDLLEKAEIKLCIALERAK